MDLVVTALVLTSAAIHPLREFWIKDDIYPEGLTFAVILQFGLFSALHTVALGVDLRPALAVWPLVLLSALGLFMYFFSVVATLKRGDFSIYYPIMRSSPLYVVVVSAVVLGYRYSITMLLGIGLVLIGAFFLQYQRDARFLSDPRILITAVLAMVGHGTLTLADAEATRAVNNARPFLREAKAVKILSINLEPAERGAAPGSGITEHLARHDIKAEPLRVTVKDPVLSDVILSTAAKEKIDLLVMGAYGNRGLRERILGGVTSHVINTTTVPVLLSH